MPIPTCLRRGNDMVASSPLWVFMAGAVVVGGTGTVVVGTTTPPPTFKVWGVRVGTGESGALELRVRHVRQVRGGCVRGSLGLGFRFSLLVRVIGYPYLLPPYYHHPSPRP